jgi:hypothetical protein
MGTAQENTMAIKIKITVCKPLAVMHVKFASPAQTAALLKLPTASLLSGADDGEDDVIVIGTCFEKEARALLV